MMIIPSTYRVEAVDTAHAALDIIAEGLTDLVIMDIGLPDYSGLELLRRMRGSGQQAKVIVMSGRGSVESAEEALKLGVVAYLLKPFNFLEVLALVQDSLPVPQAESVLSEPMRISSVPQVESIPEVMLKSVEF
jgi:DNA-binding response OmpR family regulator